MWRAEWLVKREIPAGSAVSPDRPVSTLGLGPRAHSALTATYGTVGKCLGQTSLDFAKLKGVGQKSLAEVREAFRALDLLEIPRWDDELERGPKELRTSDLGVFLNRLCVTPHVAKSEELRQLAAHLRDRGLLEPPFEDRGPDFDPGATGWDPEALVRLVAAAPNGLRTWQILDAFGGARRESLEDALARLKEEQRLTSDFTRGVLRWFSA